MPILTVKIGAQKSKQTTTRISAALSELTHRLLHKPLELIAISIDYADPDEWFIGGKSLTELGQSSFYLDIKITDETNTKAEKELYIRQTFDAFSAVLGKLNEKSYIHVEDVRAAAYGYGGLTQEYRYQHKSA